jgi:hypothetical protein
MLLDGCRGLHIDGSMVSISYTFRQQSWSYYFFTDRELCRVTKRDKRNRLLGFIVTQNGNRFYQRQIFRDRSAEKVNNYWLIIKSQLSLETGTVYFEVSVYFWRTKAGTVNEGKYRALQNTNTWSKRSVLVRFCYEQYYDCSRDGHPMHKWRSSWAALGYAWVYAMLHWETHTASPYICICDFSN